LRDKKPIIHLLLFSPGLDLLVSGKLALPEVSQNFALLLGFAENLELAAPQVFELGSLLMQRGDSPASHSIAGYLELHLHGGHTHAEFLLHLDQGIGPIQFRLLPLLLRLNHFTGDDLKALALSPLETLPTSEHGL
jgi:hypothetical protein